MTTLARYVAALRNCGLRSSDRVAVALSGGPDSLALASMTVWWQGFVRNQQTPLALIVDHKLRPESTEEAHAVAAQAEGLGMQTRVLALGWPPGEVAQGDRMVAAREARYAALLRACGEMGRTHLLLAHHADDQAETFLLRLLHASGVVGLACMPAVAEKRTEFGRIKVVRPLLGFHKAELEAYCQRSRLPYIVDPTNSELSYHRNRIRHVLRQMPSLADRSGGDNATGSSGGGSSSGGSERLAGTGAGRPAAPATIWQEEIEVPERGSGSSSSSDSSGTGTGGSDGQSIVEDLLLLQRRCQAAGQRQQMLSDQVLQWAVLRTSCPDLPTRPREEQQAGQPLLVRPGREMSEAQLEAWRRRQQRRQAESAVRHAWRSQQPWFIDWDARLTLVARALRSVPFALLSAPCFFEGQVQEQVALGALGRVLQAVSGRKYPPPLVHTTRLRQMLLDGRMEAVFTGGGCLVRRLPRSKGRNLLCTPHDQHLRAEELLARLPPINEYEAARQQKKREAAAAAKAAAKAAAATEAEARTLVQEEEEGGSEALQNS